MLFCEKCNFITSENCCPLCGNKKLRAVCDTDFCFFVDLDEFNFNMLESALKEKTIDMIGVPFYPHGVTYGTVGRAQGRKVYIRYKDMDKVKEIYKILFGNAD